MKYKIFGIIMAVVMVAAACAAAYIEQREGTEGSGKRYHQHLEEAAYTPCSDHGDDTFCSHLPLIFIETGGEEIPGAPLSKDKDGNEIFTVTESGDAMLPITFSVVDQEGSNHHVGDAPSVAAQGNIRIRGNSSRYFDKQSYLLRITEEDGVSNKDLPLMGMDAHHEWALYGPCLDKSLIRNYMWYNIAGEIMDYAPNVRFCELFLNGEYRGLYVLTETITNGENCRLNLTEPVDGAEQVGYALRLDRGSSNPEKNIETFSQYALRNLQEMDIVWPGTKNLTPERRDYIQQDFSDFEKALYSYDYDSRQYGQYQWLDLDSFVDYFIINEFTCNYDAGWLSTYVYKDVGGKFKMCIWDFNSACDNYQESSMEIHEFQMQNNVWFFMLAKEEEFDEAIIDRYRQLRETYLSDSYLSDYISEVTEWLGPAIDRNFEVWGYTFDENMLSPASRNPRSHGEAVRQLSDFCAERGAWMDQNIEVLRQYGHPSKVKKFNH